MRSFSSMVLLGLLLIRKCSSLTALEYPTTLYSVPTPYLPAFGKLLYNPLTNEIDYAYSSFTGIPNDPDKVLRIPSVSRNYKDKSKMVSHLVTDEILWPNEINGIPLGAFNTHYWTSASAFFLPGKDNGSISLIDMTDPYNVGAPIPISPYDDGIKWYYHRVLWRDMDSDGDYDAITARAYGNATEAFEAELVWFENPGIEPVEPFWNTHIIYTGYEDVAFRLHNFPSPDGNGDILVIASSGFFSQALTLTWTTDGDWSNPDSIQHRVIDDFGWYFDLWVTCPPDTYPLPRTFPRPFSPVEDLNGDGMLEIVASTWYRREPGAFGSLVAYEMPAMWWADKWKRHVVSLDFRRIFLINGNGAPGGMVVFWPSQQMKENGEKPHIILSGDDDGHAYLFVPESQDPTDWKYKQSTIFRAFGTVGAIAVTDIDDDGFQEVFVPAYSTSQIIVMSYKP